jgi:hypothetical protein
VKPEQYESAKAAWTHTSPLVPETMRKLRESFGEIEYLRVCELHQSGFPHYHALIRSGFVPQKALSQEWGRLTGAPVVWIARIDQSFSSFRYLTKYLTKLHRIEWTDRHVSYSRNFFRPEDTEKLAYPAREIRERSDVHPWKWLADHYSDTEVALEADGTYTLPHPPGAPIYDTPLADFGLEIPKDDDYDAFAEPNQSYIPGMEDVEKPQYR